MPDTEKDTVWYEEGLSFECSQCGNCCTGPPGFVWFDEAEGEAMAGQLGLTVEAFHKKYCKKKQGRWTLDEVSTRNGFDCVFLRRDSDGKALCSVYSVRPTQCRTWPFWPENLKTERHWARSAKNCPGMKHGGTFFPVDQVRVILAKNKG
jgi:uncharacterized protein